MSSIECWAAILPSFLTLLVAFGLKPQFSSGFTLKVQVKFGFKNSHGGEGQDAAAESKEERAGDNAGSSDGDYNNN